jgi:hypothetical protein
MIVRKEPRKGVESKSQNVATLRQPALFDHLIVGVVLEPGDKIDPFGGPTGEKPI